MSCHEDSGIAFYVLILEGWKDGRMEGWKDIDGLNDWRRLHDAVKYF